MRKNLLVLILLLVCAVTSNIVLAATISGSIYDLGLDKEVDVVIEIDTVPKQTLISKTGDYALNIPIGSYTIRAFTESSEASESIVVSDDGEYIIDLILEESTVDSYLYGDIDSDINVSSDLPGENDYTALIVIVSAIIVLVILLFIYLIYVRKTTDKKIKQIGEIEENHNLAEHTASHSNLHSNSQSKSIEIKALDQYEHKILSMIRKEKRTTQKDIRKEIPLSESKISLVIADLENKGKIRKIKKGRGNILIFVKD